MLTTLRELEMLSKLKAEDIVEWLQPQSKLRVGERDSVGRGVIEVAQLSLTHVFKCTVMW